MSGLWGSEIANGGGSGGTFASQAQAEAGVNTTTYMNPLRTKQAIVALALTDIDVSTTGAVSASDSVMGGIGKLQATKAPSASPTFTGTPAAPTATAGTNTTQIATTAFVRTEVANLLASAPGALDTLDELAAALGDDANFAGTMTTALAAKAPSASPSFTGVETHAGTFLFTEAAMGADAIDVTKMGNTKIVPASNPTYTFSATPSDRQEWALELTGDTVARTVTIPSSRNVATQEDITTFVMPANGYVVLSWRRKGSVNLLQGVPGTKVMIPFAIQTPADGDYTIILKSIWAGNITDLTVKSATGTCTLTGKINSTALGGTASSVTSTESSQSHSSANTVAVGDDIVLTVSANSAATKVVGRFEMTVF